jgi:hypothetical protein
MRLGNVLRWFVLPISFKGAFMLRKVFLCIAAAVVLCVPASISVAQVSSGAIPMPADRAADSYAIYSLLMPGAPFDTMSPQQNQRWAIADVTVNITDMDPSVPPEGQLKAPEDHPKRFQEAVRDYEVHKYERIQLTSQLHLSLPYQLMNADQVAELRRSRTSIDPGDLQAKYAGYPGVTFFSQVYFNAGHTAALVYMNNWCANLCAAGQWVYLEKHGSTWVRRSGIYAKMS